MYFLFKNNVFTVFKHFFFFLSLIYFLSSPYFFFLMVYLQNLYVFLFTERHLLSDFSTECLALVFATLNHKFSFTTAPSSFPSS